MGVVFRKPSPLRLRWHVEPENEPALEEMDGGKTWNRFGRGLDNILDILKGLLEINTR